MPRFLFPLLFVCLLPFLASAEAPWVSVSVPVAEEASAVALLESHGIPALSWSSAVLEVSAFEGLETVPLRRLETQLLPQDPRWDPWLRQLPGWFEPQNGQIRVWVPSEKASQAADLVGRPQVPSSSTRPSVGSAPLVTGWALISLTLLFVLLKAVSGVRFGWPSWRQPRRWVWVPVCLLLLVGGGILAGRPVSGPSLPPGSAEAWVQHRWYQETWPWGSRWEDYAPGAVWTFPSYEHRNGRLTEVSTALAAGSAGWKSSLSSSLDPHHAVRIFGSFLP